MIAIIPARGGSKGLPGKNIKQLNGVPLICYSIKTALNAKSISKVIVSTDDMTIAEIAKECGAEIPFMRPKALALDQSLSIDGYIYTMDRLISEYGYYKDEFMVLLPTTPFRNYNDVDNSSDVFYSKQADSVVSCVEVDHPIDWAFKINRNKKVESGSDTCLKMNNRQAYRKLYVPNGGVYILRNSLLKEHRTFYYDNTYCHIMPAERSIDIDTELDFKFAEFLIKENLFRELMV